MCALLYRCVQVAAMRVLCGIFRRYSSLYLALPSNHTLTLTLTRIVFVTLSPRNFRPGPSGDNLSGHAPLQTNQRAATTFIHSWFPGRNDASCSRCSDLSESGMSLVSILNSPEAWNLGPALVSWRSGRAGSRRLCSQSGGINQNHSTRAEPPRTNSRWVSQTRAARAEASEGRTSPEQTPSKNW